ncbi:hypothetical protein KIH87_11900 [Paraneptunicella aestuarii]|uniref:CFI-box-CTERM domain-containing protein n=1 Tax=Paraneptunicella aestuarii TaxID=2831148 RepID=UPI001E4D2E1A|nr:CFI-box-CTERM domain-containing protein [Paraneptunicella aestuarii]UAA37417.1 hypothetical protein KIH87_11900 [Paraneptunicella aestuarii]
MLDIEITFYGGGMSTIKCDSCHGTGGSSHTHICYGCGGTGGNGSGGICGACHGSAQQTEQIPCGICLGKGYVYSSGGSSSCFIATAVYGSSNHEDVMFLRNYRDVVLSKSKSGRFFIAVYYAVGPYLAFLPRNIGIVKKVLRVILEYIVKTLKQ